MKWETVKLGDIADFSNGLNFDKRAYSDGVKLVGVSNFGNRFSPDISELSEVSSEVVREADLLQAGDIVFVRSNGNKELVGRCMLIAEATEPVTYSGFVIRCRIHNPRKYDPVFFTYHFKNKAFRRAMAGTAVGANIQNLSQGRLSSYAAFVPDTDSQHRIAEMLSAYDDLIENNQKQIKLLEEAAQRLYKEWFIDLRFPGYESTPIHDGIPEGWANEPIDNVFSIKYGKNLPTTLISKTGRYPVYGANGVIGSYNEKNCNDYVVLITSRGNGSGDVLRTFHKESFVTNNSFIVVGRRPPLGVPFTHQMMMSTDFKSVCTGSAQPQLTNNSINTLSVILPAEHLIEQYNRTAEAMYKATINLITQNDLLIEARDRLLPKLMSGEIEV